MLKSGVLALASAPGADHYNGGSLPPISHRPILAPRLYGPLPHAAANRLRLETRIQTRRSTMKATFVLVTALLFALAIQPGFAQEGVRQILTPDNGGELVELARLGRGSTDHVAFSPDGQTLAVAGTMGVWLYSAADVATPTEPPLLDTQGIALALAFSPDGTTLAVTTSAGLQLWDVASQTLISTTPLKRGCEALAFSP